MAAPRAKIIFLLARFQHPFAFVPFFLLWPYSLWPLEIMPPLLRGETLPPLLRGATLTGYLGPSEGPTLPDTAVATFASAEFPLETDLDRPFPSTLLEGAGDDIGETKSLPSPIFRSSSVAGDGDVTDFLPGSITLKFFKVWVYDGTRLCNKSNHKERAYQEFEDTVTMQNRSTVWRVRTHHFRLGLDFGPLQSTRMAQLFVSIDVVSLALSGGMPCVFEQSRVILDYFAKVLFGKNIQL